MKKEEETISLNQLSYMIKFLQDYDWFIARYDTDYTYLSDRLEVMTLEDRREFWWCITKEQFKTLERLFTRYNIYERKKWC